VDRSRWPSIILGLIVSLSEVRYQSEKFTLGLRSFYNCAHYGLSAVLGFPFDSAQITVSSRIGRSLQIGIMFVAVILNATYTANLASILTQNKVVYSSNIQSICLAYPSTINPGYPERQKQELTWWMNEWASQFVEQGGALPVYAGGECATCDQTPGSPAMVDWCIAAVQQGRVDAWVDNTAVLEEGWSRNGCASDLAISPDLSYGSEMFVLELSCPSGQSCYLQDKLERLDKALLQGGWMGITKTLLDKWLEKGSCSPSISQGDEIRFMDMQGLFIIAGGGFLTAVLVIGGKRLLVCCGLWKPISTCAQRSEAECRGMILQTVPAGPAAVSRDTATMMLRIEELQQDLKVFCSQVATEHPQKEMLSVFDVSSCVFKPDTAR